MAIKKPREMLLTPIVRTKNTRGLLPLQMDHRMKLGWDCPLSVASTILTAGARAEGWVVACSAERQAARSLCERFNSLGAVNAR